MVVVINARLFAVILLGLVLYESVRVSQDIRALWSSGGSSSSQVVDHDIYDMQTLNGLPVHQKQQSRGEVIKVETETIFSLRTTPVERKQPEHVTDSMEEVPNASQQSKTKSSLTIIDSSSKAVLSGKEVPKQKATGAINEGGIAQKSDTASSSTHVPKPPPISIRDTIRTSNATTSKEATAWAGKHASEWAKSQLLKEKLVVEVLSKRMHKPATVDDAWRAIRKLWRNEWTSLDWILNGSLLDAAYERQKDFLEAADPLAYQPQPVIFRPLLLGMGWGNMIYDLATHLMLALMLDRPFLMMLDRKDRFGKLGWNASTYDDDGTNVLEYRLIDWRIGGKQRLMDAYFGKMMTVKTHVAANESFELLSCRWGYALYDRCEKGQSFEGLFSYFRSIPHKVLYSEYSRSFNLPLRQAPSYRAWFGQNISPSDKHTVVLMRFAWNVLFRFTPKFYSTAVFPHLRQLTEDFTRPFVTVHIRTGHLEGGKIRNTTLDEDRKALHDCYEVDQRYHKRKWLLLADSAQLTMASASWAYATTNEGFTLEKFHVAKASYEDQALAWDVTLRDWALLVESTGPLVRRSRLSTAFSFSQRGAMIGALDCVHPNRSNPVQSCANRFFEQVCEHY